MITKRVHPLRKEYHADNTKYAQKRERFRKTELIKLKMISKHGQ
jgi:hypothetical protein